MRTNLVGIVVCLICAGSAFAESQPQAVPTFHCVGLYWSPEDGAQDNVCRVRYRQVGAPQWREALPLWFDGRQSPALPPERWRQYRGSIVNLTPGTQYEIELSLQTTGRHASISVQTWSEDFPIARTVPVRNSVTPLIVDQSGSPDGYVLYAPAPGRGTPATTIDVMSQHAQCVEVRASYVILRGLTLKNAQQDGIRLFENCHDIVIENCDISGWGRIAEDGWGRDYDGAIYSKDRALKRVIIQRNYLHHPRSNSNNWRQSRSLPGQAPSSHPQGPQTVVFWDSEGNHVIRYNTVDSDDEHYYNDCFGAGSNFSVRGFPNRDSDIYGNFLSHCWDDAIESEGANCNVRIWGNYTTESLTSIACASVSLGPLYVWRNVSGVMRETPDRWTGGFLKTSDNMGGGRIFVFHNTILQPPRPPEAGPETAGASQGLGWGGAIVNVTSRNNILHVTRNAIRNQKGDSLGDYDYDLYSGRSAIPAGQELHGIKGEPIYAEGSGLQDGKGQFFLSPTSPGYDAALRLPNFNDDLLGQGPDIGTHEAGTPPMEFGVDAYRPQGPPSSETVHEKPVQRGMGLGSPTQNSALEGPFQPMNHRQDADATRLHGQDARATPHAPSEIAADALAARHSIKPGEVWPDDRGRHIQAHGGGILKQGDTFYWFGEDRARDNERGRRYVSCYSSKNLTDWTFRNQVLKLADPENFGPAWVLERPKVFYNAKTKQYVMYMHIDGPAPGTRGGYQLARVGVATCATVDGDYKYLRSFRPLGQESRDIGQFIDDDGSAYLIFEDRPAQGFHIARLSDDYLTVEKDVCLIRAPLEGGAVVHFDGLYYVVGSALTGWRPNPNKYATATSLAGPWSEFQDIAPPETNTYGSQSTMLVKVVGTKTTTVIFLGDIWKPRAQWDSCYLWMPLEIGQGKLRLPEPHEWTIDIETGETTIGR